MRSSVFGLLVGIAACGGQYAVLPAGEDDQPARPNDSTSVAGSPAATGNISGTGASSTVGSIDSSEAGEAGQASVSPVYPNIPLGACGCSQPITPNSAPDALPVTDCSCNGSVAFWSCATTIQSTGPQVIGPEGGTLTLDDSTSTEGGGDLTITIPAGALSAPTSLSVSDALVPSVIFLGASARGYLFEPLGLRFAAPIEVRLRLGSAAALLVFVLDECTPTPSHPDEDDISGLGASGELKSTGILFAETIN